MAEQGIRVQLFPYTFNRPGSRCATRGADLVRKLSFITQIWRPTLPLAMQKAVGTVAMIARSSFAAHLVACCQIMANTSAEWTDFDRANTEGIRNISAALGIYQEFWKMLAIEQKNPWLFCKLIWAEDIFSFSFFKRAPTAGRRKCQTSRLAVPIQSPLSSHLKK